MVSLQTSIAKHLAQQQIDKTEPDSSRVTGDTSTKPEKPTASVQPTMQRDPEMLLMDSSATDSCDSDKASDSELYNGPSAQDTTSPLDIHRGGAVSLLNPQNFPLGSNSNISNSLNGDIDNVDVTVKTRTDGAAIKSRSSSVDSSQPNIMRVNWPPGDKSVSSPVTSKNIVISAINKSNNTVLTKVIGANQSGKLAATLSPGAVKNLSNPTSILSPRVLGQSSKVTGITMTKTVGSSQVTGSTAKVINASSGVF